MKRIFLITITLSAFSLYGLNAQTTSPGIDAKQNNQKARIAEGVASGDLTRAETAELTSEQRKIQKMEKVAKADRIVTRRERKIIRREQRKANKHIARQKNDCQTRR